MSVRREGKSGAAVEIKQKTQIKTPAKAGVFILEETEGFSYVSQAAESLASDSLRIPRVSRAGGLLISEIEFAAQTILNCKIKTPAKAGVCILAETEGFEPSIQV